MGEMMVIRSEDFVCSSESERVRWRTYPARRHRDGLFHQLLDLSTCEPELPFCCDIKLQGDLRRLLVGVFINDLPEEIALTIKGRKRGLG